MVVRSGTGDRAAGPDHHDRRHSANARMAHIGRGVVDREGDEVPQVVPRLRRSDQISISCAVGPTLPVGVRVVDAELKASCRLVNDRTGQFGPLRLRFRWHRNGLGPRAPVRVDPLGRTGTDLVIAGDGPTEPFDGHGACQGSSTLGQPEIGEDSHTDDEECGARRRRPPPPMMPGLSGSGHGSPRGPVHAGSDKRVGGPVRWPELVCGPTQVSADGFARVCHSHEELVTTQGLLPSAASMVDRFLGHCPSSLCTCCFGRSLHGAPFPLRLLPLLFSHRRPPRPRALWHPSERRRRPFGTLVTLCPGEIVPEVAVSL